MSKQLKPCPFCKSKTLSIEELSSAWGTGDSEEHVICDNCASCAPLDIWNDRPAETEISELLSKVGDFLQDTAEPAFILAMHDYPVSHGPESQYKELKNILKLIETH